VAELNIRFHPAAYSELERSVLWYAERSQLVADTFLDEVTTAIGNIQLYPMASQSYSHDCRRHVLKRFPFSIIYRQKDEVIEIVAVAHQRQKPGFWSSR